MNKILLCLIFFGAIICAPSLVSQNHLQVYIFVSEECPACIYMTSDLNLLSEKYQESADFHLVFVKKNSTQKSADSFVKKYKLKQFDTILDNAQELCKKLGGTVTPEAVVLEDTGETLYRGRISNAFYAPGKIRKSGKVIDLDVALNYIIQHHEVALPWLDAVGCYITYEKKN